MIFIRRHAIQTEQDNYMQTPSKFLIGQEKNQITKYLHLLKIALMKCEATSVQCVWRAHTKKQSLNSRGII